MRAPSYSSSAAAASDVAASAAAAAAASAVATLLLLLLLLPLTASAADLDLDLGEGTSLGPRGYITTLNPVTHHADIALDLRDMSTSLLVRDFDAVRRIYSGGKNSDLYGSDGEELPNKRPLRWGNTNAATVFRRDMTYIFHVYGLARGDPDAVDDGLGLYADGAVDGMIDRGSNGLMAAADGGGGGMGSELAVEAARALNLWMFASHRAWDAWRKCEGGKGGDLGGLGGAVGGDAQAAIAKLDEAVAYWTGSGFGDGEGESVRGYSLFALAQENAALFGTEGVTLANANFNIKRLYDSAVSLLDVEGACTPADKPSVDALYANVNDLIGQMTVPLVQSLIAAMYERDGPRVRLYASSFVPRLSGCRPSSHAILQDGLMDRGYDPAEFDLFLEVLRSTYECLGLDCADVGSYMGGKVPMCRDVPPDLPLAGYTPTSGVREESKIDVDILQIKVATKMGAYDVAHLIYSRGRNSRYLQSSESSLSSKKRKYRTLKMMATSRDRNLVDPFYDEFQMYFDDDDYAHTIVEGALTGAGKWGKASASQRSEAAVKTLSFHVMYMYALTQLHESIEACLAHQSGTDDMNVKALGLADASERMARQFDEAVAYMTGSLEGPDEGGSYRTRDGLLLYSLANVRCQQFGQCTNKPGEDGPGPARILGVYQDLYYAAKGAMNSGNCKSLTATVHKIEHVVMIPVIQSIIRYAIKNERLPPDSPSKDVAEGEIFALAVLPIVDLYEDESADVLERNMLFQRGRKPVVDGDQAVADALYEIMDEFGIPCDFVGTTEGVTPCVNDGGYTSRTSGAAVGGRGRRGGVVVTTVMAVSVAASYSLAALFFFFV